MAATFYNLYSDLLDRSNVGHTVDDLRERLLRHLSGHSGWTSRAIDRRVAHSESYPDKAGAMKREREVKRWKSRSRLEDFIRTTR